MMNKWACSFEIAKARACDTFGAEGKIAGAAYFALCLPPPVHGQAIVNASVLRTAQNLKGSDKIEIADIGPGRQTLGLQYHLTRMFRVARAAFMIVEGSTKSNKQIYTVFESGLGIIYNFAIIGMARMLKYNIILHHHTSRHTLGRQRSFALLQRVAGPSCLHVVLSQKMAVDLRLAYPNIKKVLICENACHIPDNDLTIAPTTLPHSLRVGFLSNLCVEKGLDVIMDAATKCRDLGLEIKFVLAGPTVDQAAEEILRNGQNRLGDYIEILGPIAAEAKSDFFKSIDVFLFPTRYRFEAQPLVILEAMSYGLPIIVTDCGYLAELVGRHGIVLGLNDCLPDKIVDHLEKIAATSDNNRSVAIDVKVYFRQLHARASGQLGQLMNALFGVQSDDQFGPSTS
jgi:glycosyltransferase involved in cell wall biosynthesis